MVPYRFTPLGAQTLTCGTAAAGTVLTLPTGHAAADGRMPLRTTIRCTAGTVRYLDSGGTPSATAGMPLFTSDEPLQYEADPSKLRFIGVSAAGTVEIAYYG